VLGLPSASIPMPDEVPGGGPLVAERDQEGGHCLVQSADIRAGHKFCDDRRIL
jgi:hypothetical protein